MGFRRSSHSSVALAALVAALVGCLTLPATGLARNRTGLPPDSSLLFALNGKGGELEPVGKPRRRLFSLTLKGVDKSVVWFADHPRRDAGRLSPQGLFGDWGRLGFGKSPPNAALVVSGARASEDTMALELRLRHYDPGTRTARFTARALGSVGGDLRHLERRLDARVPAHFRNASLFIDNGEYLAGCTDSRPQLMAVEATTLWKNFQELVGFLPAEGQTVPLSGSYLALYALIGSTYEEGFSTSSYHLPKLAAPAAGTSWYMCWNQVFPTPGELGGAILGEVAFFPTPVADRSSSSWLPADGRWLVATESPEYARAVAQSFGAFTLPNVPAPEGMKAMVNVESGIIPQASVGQLRMFAGEPPGSIGAEIQANESASYLSGGVEWAPAEGQTVSAKEFPGLANLLGGGVAGESATIKLPSIPSPAPGVRWFIALTGAWPLHSL